MSEACKPIRILHMIGALEVGGSQAMVINLLKKIDRAKVQFDFIVDHPDRMQLAPVVEELGSKIYIMPTFIGTNIFSVKKAWTDFFQSHPEYKILHSHVRSYASLYIPIAKKYGVKTIIHSHSTSSGSGISSLVKKCLQYPLRYQADYMIACSAQAGEWLYGKKACTKDNYMFVPNAIDTEKYKFDKTVRDSYRKEFGVENKFVIGHVGRFHEAKNHMFLLQVFKSVYDIRKDAALVLVGDGDLRPQIEKKIRELGLNSSVILTGNRNDVASIMQAMDVFVFPSLWEGLPVTVVEAQAAGLTCLISDRVTSDVHLSELIVSLPVEDADVWVKHLVQFQSQRKNVTDAIVRAGFDVVETARKMTEFYISLSGR